MDEYIKRADALEAIRRWCGDCGGAIEAVLSVPAVHEKWVPMYRSGMKVDRGYVSTCCDMWAARKSPYCPHCGAKMDGGGKARG